MLNKTFLINKKLIGLFEKPFIIAEAGSNFNQDLNVAKKLIDSAVKAGADAVKFQLFRAEILQPKNNKLYEIFKSVELNPDWIPLLCEHARNQGIEFTASAFDNFSVDILEDVGVTFHKVASSELINLKLIYKMALTGKPLIISTGMSDLIDVHQAVDICYFAKNINIALMQCGALYPLPLNQVNLRVIKTFKSIFECPVGFSDHTLDSIAAITAVGMGCNVFEKHFTLNKKSQGPDHFYALEPEELTKYIENLHLAYSTLGRADKEMLPEEKKYGRRNGIFSARKLKSGEIIKPEDIEIKRPALGLRERYSSLIINERIKQDIEEGHPITLDMIDFEC